jgi:cyclic pyranopterin phosphate synthase
MTEMSTSLDTAGRPLRSLRLSVTDRCNIRCAYCMPEADYVWLPRDHLLSFEEIARLTGVFVQAGVERLRLTGGEPLLRRGLPDLVRRLAAQPGLRDLAITTNGVLLASHAAALKAAGLHRVTVSLDTLQPDRFRALTRFDQHAAVLDGIAAAAREFGGLKIDTVVMRGVNDDELVDMVEFARRVNAEVRFIEYMDVGGATRWRWQDVVTRVEILGVLGAHYGPLRPLHEASSAPADRFALPDGTTVGIIASTTAPFCRTCDRARLTADGLLLLCLYASTGLDLRTPLRSGASDADLLGLLRECWQARTDHGAESRLAEAERAALIPAERLRGQAHLEMHTRGG